jgi:hypothetical protein
VRSGGAWTYFWTEDVLLAAAASTEVEAEESDTAAEALAKLVTD